MMHASKYITRPLWPVCGLDGRRDKKISYACAQIVIASFIITCGKTLERRDNDEYAAFSPILGGFEADVALHRAQHSPKAKVR